ncbi:MAG: hypothetical protein HY363_02295 [Candidatus Aenigmarchaeota archaeon]|nr:hypothetical protein [Candidatus Aenigmarchaeota archaeon]
MTNFSNSPLAHSEKLLGKVRKLRLLRRVLFTVCFGILLFAAFAQEKGIFGTKLPWYAIEPWEAEVCAKWGGQIQTAQNTVETGITPYSDMTLSVQGKRVKLPDGEFLYEISYYAESFGATTNYKIDMIDKKTQKEKTITQGMLEPSAAESDYITQYMNESYTTLRIIHDRGAIVVPIVEVKK